MEFVLAMITGNLLTERENFSMDLHADDRHKSRDGLTSLHKFFDKLPVYQLGDG